MPWTPENMGIVTAIRLSKRSAATATVLAERKDSILLPDCKDEARAESGDHGSVGAMLAAPRAE